jgi:hypothetical protein
MRSDREGRSLLSGEALDRTNENTMTLRLTFIALIAFSAAGLASAQEPAAAARPKDVPTTLLPAEPEQALRDFLYALYANDAVDFQKRILPEANSIALIGPQTFTQEQLDKLRKDINALPLHQTSPPSLEGLPLANSSAPIPVGTKTIYLTQFRGVVLIVPMQRSENGWKVDVRFWLAMRKQREVRLQKTDPELVAKGFLFHVLAKKPDALNEFTSESIKGEDYTSANNLPPGDLDQILSLCIEMPMVRARSGERVLLPSGEVAVGSDQSESLVLIGLMGPVEVPFLLRRVGGAWKVVPQRYFEMLRKAGAL